MSIEIIPAIMPTSKEDFENKTLQVVEFVKNVQVDLMDGIFVPDRTWMPTGSLNTGFPSLGWELDLMINSAEGKIPEWIRLGASRLIFHVEAIKDFNKIENMKPFLKSNSIEVGLSLNNDTSLDAIKLYIDKVDFIQCMGIAKIGYQGEPFDERVIERVRNLRRDYPQHIISVDGGVSLETASKLVEAGVNRLVVGSTIFKSENIGRVIDELKHVTNR